MSGPDDLDSVHWNLGDLLGERTVDDLLDEALERARAFAERSRGALSEIDAAGLGAAMAELGAIHDLVGRAGSYAHLDFSIDTADPPRGALLARVEERSTALATELLFFDLEWTALDDARADELLADAALDDYRHYLRTLRRYRPHLLSEPEERILTEKALSGRSAWARLFEEVTAAIEVPLEEPSTLDVALARLSAPSREVRRAAAEAVTRGLEPGLRTRAFAFNTLLVDKSTDDRLRSYPHWLSARNLDNEAGDESVAALIAAVAARYELPRRWYRLKARLLGLERLADYDRMAPLSTGEEDAVDWPTARHLVLDAYEAFSPTLGALVRSFFKESWIDGPPSRGKRGGAFCAYTVPSVHPYVMLNFTGRRRDVLVLAHELGHGVHAALARRQSIFHQGTPLTVAETASVFGEALTFSALLEASPTPQARLELLAQDIDGSIATVFRQVALNRFEHAVHTERREVGELSVERFNECWTATQGDLLGDAVEITDGYRTWWSYVHHFIAAPGYVYAYAYGELLAMSVFERYLEEGAGFEERYIELLATGGSRSPQELGEIVGIDLRDPAFWDRGLDLLERRLEDAEAAAEAAV